MSKFRSQSRWLALPLAVVLVASAAGPAVAQTVGSSVPPVSASPEYTPPVRENQPPLSSSKNDSFAAKAANSEIVSRFRSAYQVQRRPRLAIYWNQQLENTLAEWYGDERLVINRTDGFGLTGDTNEKGTASGSTIIQSQRRVSTGSGRAQPSESWTWEFQDGFLAPLLEAGAVVVDRTAIIRFTAAKGGGDSGMQTVEATALQGMADYLVEVLVAAQSQATTGFELHARVIDTRTGQVLSQVNSRSMAGWEARDEYTANEHGYSTPDEDDQKFGPEDETRRYKAGSRGYVRQHKPPKLRLVAQQLSNNVMNGMIAGWSR